MTTAIDSRATETTTYSLSIKPVDGEAFIYGFNLGTDIAIAMRIAAEKYHARNLYADSQTESVAIVDIRGFVRGNLNIKIIDVYDGSWASAA